ncbi:DNA-binding GntR family transcriptional regulator [Rhizobium sp. PP-F2F-G38]|nr:DNA-binding GntR family transcriptional regulator [Rhizobium sp. PP-WC-1G-195]PYE92724.1 DNA-binding GntR family transcriptional regulator [Rhizobium sp. PP-F2F-G38]TCL89652.1 DNA-binding GntR family transcriptional regulator [Rhizobium sp. PP-WC-2G-219]TCP77245.1 DNA-binding GntR family transcriptional regulator [Rhizobium sp. PP-CC-2G-626]TCQ03333.1 DNA-binding GntR family transcriptional regulator [Rhizobium sp. PP-F2F-G36]
MKPERNNVLHLECAKEILENLAAGRNVAGDRVSDAALASRLGISRTPVRKALDLLLARGILRRPSSKRGYTLAQPVTPAILAKFRAVNEEHSLYHAILRDRVSKRLPETVSELGLADQFDVSRSTVRNVLAKLASEGIVLRLKGNGWQFRRAIDCYRAAQDSYEFRMIIECNALMADEFSMSADSIIALRTAHATLLSEKETDSATWFRINANFHQSLVDGAGNEFLSEAMRQQNALRRLNEYAEISTLLDERAIQSCLEHLEILDAIEAKDVNLASTLLRRHLTAALTEYL